VTRSTAGRTLLLGVLAAGWAAAAWFLWQSRVPGSLHLPRLDEHDYFTAAQLRASASFSRVEVLIWLLGIVVQVVVLALYAWRGHRFMRESAAGPIGSGMLLGMLGFAILWLAEVPVSVLELWWQRRHDLSSVGYVEYVFGNWFALGGEFVFLCLALLIVMGFARLLGEHWWLPAAPVFVGIALLFVFVYPYLTPTHGLDDPRLRASAQRFEKIEHVEHTPVVVQDVRDVTSLPNAEAMGVGPSRRVVLWDTLVDGPYTYRELEVVLAHELGHLSRNHIWKGVGWYALFAFPGTFLIAQAVRRRGGMARPEAVPLSVLVLVVLGLLATPIDNVISRHREAEADWMSLLTTRDPAAAKQLFRDFVPATLSDPNPGTFEYVLLETHPTIMQRIEMAEAWRRRYATSAAQSP
jgi:STE24 endopeptidase